MGDIPQCAGMYGHIRSSVQSIAQDDQSAFLAFAEKHSISA
jgi:hypothetical protein